MSSRTITKVFFLFSLILIAACSSKGIVADPLVEETNDPETTTPETPTDNNFYRGTTTGFAGHLESFGNLVYKENGVQTDPYKSIADHGGNMVRFRIDLLPFASSYSTGYADPDFRSVEKVKVEMQRAKDNGLKTLITFGYQSHALEDSQKLNDYVAPLEWQSIADDIEKLKEAVYEHTYVILENYVESNLIPEIVAIGNETNWRMLQPNVLEDELQPYSAERTVTLLNSGSKAVRDINMNYGLDIQIAMHIFDASNLQWWMNTNVSLGLDFDIMALSHYQGWHSLGDFASWSEVVNWVSDNYHFFLIMVTAQLFTTGGNDDHVNILWQGTNIPDGYLNPPTTDTQREYLKDFAQEIYDSGGVGLLVWGGEWVGADCLIYADQWGAGSS